MGKFRRTTVPGSSLKITTTEAITLLKKQGYGTVTKPTTINWLRQYNLAIKLGGRWQIDKKKFEKFLLQGTQNVQKN